MLSFPKFFVDVLRFLTSAASDFFSFKFQFVSSLAKFQFLSCSESFVYKFSPPSLDSDVTPLSDIEIDEFGSPILDLISQLSDEVSVCLMDVEEFLILRSVKSFSADKIEKFGEFLSNASVLSNNQVTSFSHFLHLVHLTFSAFT